MIIDEASTIIESACLIPICRAKKLIMAGDHKQLGPTIVKSEIATDPRNEKIKYFERTLFQKLIETNADKCCILNEQHRMNDTLIKFPNISFYKGVLKSDEVVKFSELHIFFDKPIIFINHKGKEDSGKGTSFSNKDEAKIVSMITNKYNSLGIDSKMLGVISFYKNQKLLINRLIRKTGIKCMTVDSYQGEEKNIIILSTVRSNDIKKREESLGFLIDYHRLNVSLTRAKNKLIIIGNETTLKRDEMTSELIEYIKNNGIFIDSSELTKKFIKPTNKEYKEAIQEKKILAEGAYQAKLALMTKSNFEDIKKKADLLLLEDNIFSGMDEY